MATYGETQIQSPQVVLNFRGAEVPQSFIAHLEMSLTRSGVNVYVDGGEFMRGRDPGSSGIEKSRIVLVIFSEMYTGSKLCLDELLKIKEQVEQGKLRAIPIYYKLSPSQVKSLDGNFGLNLWNLGNRSSDFGKLKKWKEALDFISSMIGLVFNEESSESTFIDTVVEQVHVVLSTLPRDDETNSDATPKLKDSAEDNEENKQENAGESSTPVTHEKPHQKHHVFISYGEELRRSFASQLIETLKRNGVSVFEDVNLVKGEDVGSLFSGIEESKTAIVIFSTRYTESAWCLDELVKIKELWNKSKLTVIPIYYKVEPSQVRRLEGVFGENFWSLCRMKRDPHIITWKEALESIASKVGIYLEDSSSESDCVTQIVKKVQKIILQAEEVKTSLFPSREKGESKELPTGKGETFLDKRHLVGMEQRVEQLENKLEFDSNDTRIIGVAGMPAIGKTTLAMMLHSKWNRKFIRCVPFLDIRKKSEDYGPAWLRKTLLELLLEGKVPGISDKTTHRSVKVELLETKIFAVLDDVSDKEQLEFLLGELDWIKKGSKIIITTCDKSLLEGFAHDTYVVPELNDEEAFQLFSYHAFDDLLCPFPTLSRLFIDHARGHPLVLKILGMELHRKPEAYWASKLEMVTRGSHERIHDVWRLSVDQLSAKQKDVFLDIACFFKSEDEYFVRSLLDSGDPDSSDAVSEVKDLVNKFLITIADGRVEMNIPLYKFAKDLASQWRQLGWRRLWDSNDIVRVLESKLDADNVRGIFLDSSNLTRTISFDSSTFINMRNLRYMKIYGSRCPWHCEADLILNFPDGLEFSLEEVRYLHWENFPLNVLPPDFRPKNLVDLRLPYSNITRLWEGKKDTPRLKWLDLSHSRRLRDLSAFLEAENLQRLSLEGCTSLTALPVEIQNMKSLVCLNLRGCISLLYLPKMKSISLKTLILSDCSNLDEFRLISESVEFLHLDGTAIKRLPPSIQILRRLVVLNLKNCKMLECLPNNLGNLEALDKLILSGCSKLKNLPDVRNSLKHLRILLFDGTGAKEMPSVSCFTVSEGPASADVFLRPLGSHHSVREWPCGVNVVSLLRRLCLSGNDFVSLQPDIWKLYNLKWLDVRQCRKLRSIPMLPPRLQYFDAHGCDSLERVANPIAFPVFPGQIHGTFNFSNCNKLDRDAKDNIISYTRWRSQLVLDEIARYSGGLVSEALNGTFFPGWEVPAWFSHRAYGSMLKPILPPHWCDNKFTGIGLCAVIEFNGYPNQRKHVLLQCNFKNVYGSRNRFSCTVGGWSEPRELVSSHVFIGFTSRLDMNKISDEDDEEKCVCTETLIEFEVTDGMDEIQGFKVVKCGFSLVYAPEERRNVCSV